MKDVLKRKPVGLFRHLFQHMSKVTNSILLTIFDVARAVRSMIKVSRIRTINIEVDVRFGYCSSVNVVGKYEVRGNRVP